MDSNDFLPFNLTTEETTDLIRNVTTTLRDETTAQECKKYGTFMRPLSKASQEGFFWVPFAIVLILLTLSAISYEKSERAYWHGKHHPGEATELKQKQRRYRVLSVIFTTILAMLVILCVVLEGLAGCALTYCGRHKLIWFYWGMWTLTQVGSLIAIIGVTVHQWACLGEHDVPPWNVALGTPILVITGIAHITGTLIGKKLRAWAGAEDVAPPKKFILNPELSESEQPLVSAVTIDGHIVVEYPSTWQPLPHARQKVWGHNEYGGSIVEYLPTGSQFTREEVQALIVPCDSNGSSTSDEKLLTTLGSRPMTLRTLSHISV